MSEVKVRGVMYKLPEGFREVKSGMETYYVSSEGERHELVNIGYRVNSDQPFLEYRHSSGQSKKIPLEPVLPREESNVKTGHAWELSNKLLKMLMNGGKLADDYQEKLKAIDVEFDKFGDQELKEYVLPRIKKVINEYKRTNVWDFTLLGK